MRQQCQCSEALAIVFCYGTLMSGGPLHNPDMIVCSSADSIKGTLFKVCSAFPGVKLSGKNVIKGETQVIKAEWLDAMDYMEGSMYTRHRVVTDNGVPCWVYEFNGGYRKQDIIEQWVN